MKKLFMLLLVIPLWVHADPPETAPALKVNVRMVEIYTAVMDGKKFIAGLKPGQFRIWEDNRPQKVALFETDSTSITVALLLDTTGSMQKALPFVKNAVSKLITSLRPGDSVGLYSFTHQLQTLMPITQDRTAALRALLGTRASGTTALFDAMTQLVPEVTRIHGKKFILVFTDGDDNSSALSQDVASTNLKRIGVPVYAVAQGAALIDKKLMHCLEDLTRVTGGMTFIAHNSDDLVGIFASIGEELQHQYMLGYYPDQDTKTAWRKITVQLAKPLHYKIRAKEGYKP